MTHWADLGYEAYLPAGTVLNQISAAVLVTDRLGNLLYANPFAVRLFGFPPDPAQLVGRPILSLTLADGDVGKVAELAREVLEGRSWDGAFAIARGDGSQVLARAEAVPLRHPSGSVEGIVIIAREATRRSSHGEKNRISLLERIGERLAGSLELRLTLRHVAETLVPQFADHCFIDLFEGDKLVRRAQFNAWGWVPPDGSWARVGDQIEYPEGHFCQQAMARLAPVLVEDLHGQNFPAPTQDSLDASVDVGMLSVIAAPLVARGQLLGVMSLALSRLTEREDKLYVPEDREFLGAIASRVAIAIDNALLFEEERRTALAFQTSLLPQELPALDGLEVACRYVPAKPLETHGQGIQTQVGGDWYDIIPLSAGRVGIVIGDVEGRGARAAAIMGQMRAALRAFAQDDKSPAEILRKLDDWCRTLGPPKAGAGDYSPDPPIVSCTYLVYDAWNRTLAFANAGHDAPLLIVDGEVGELEMEHKGLLLGVRGRGVPALPTYREETRHLPAGASLVLYTDGLTERRHRPDGMGQYSEDDAVRMLHHAVRQAAFGDVEAIAQAAEEAVPGDIDDDMAIVVVRTSPFDLASWERSFPAEPIRVSEARRLAQETFRSWGMERGQIELTCLLVSEVVTNVVLHTAAPGTPRRTMALQAAGAATQRSMGPAAAIEDGALGNEMPVAVPGRKAFTLRLRRGAEAVWVEVFDTDLRLPRIRSAGENDEGGRGLYLVDQLASRWGTRPTRDGKAVWFEMPLRRLPGA
ncbi:MAG TPA: SpoIIE family protein phosphatase [Streptosporangiaceae bacterium]|nr:SpoIIE family protein phosphatase [Streptosporangiaceae bacterium]